MPNEQLIDTVISPGVDAQVTSLTKLLQDLDIVMIADIKSANALNTALSNTKNFSELGKTASDASIQIEKVQQAQNKTAQTTAALNSTLAKAAADQSARDAKSEVAKNKNIEASKKEQAQAEKEAAAFVVSENKKNEALAKSNRAYNLAVKARDEARKNAKDIGIALGVESNAFKEAALNANNLAAKVEKVNTPLGDFKDKVGGYARDISSVFSKTFGYIRTLANIIPNFGIGTFFLFVGEGLKLLVEQLTQGAFALDAFTKTSSAMSAAFKDSGFKDAISSVIDLKEQIQLAKEGILDQDVVLQKYNSTIGETIGQTDSLDKAEKLLVEHSPAYIKSMFYKAAAAAALAEGTDDLLKATKDIMKAQGNQQLNDKDIAGLENIIKTSRDKNEVEQAKGLLRMGMAMRKSDAEDLKERQQYSDKLVAQTTSIYDKLTRLSNQFKLGFLSKEETDALEKRNETAFEYNKGLFDQDMKNQQAIADNEKKSYKQRYDALAKALADKKQIIGISEAQEMGAANLSKTQQQAVTDKANFERLDSEREYQKNLTALKDKQYKQDQQILKNNIQKQLDLFKKISDDPNQSYDMKLIALDEYSKKSRELIDANYKEQIKEAGKNAESIKIAEQDKDKAILQLDNQTAADRLKIQKENLAKILELSKESEQEQLETLQNGANLALRILTEAKDKRINAISLERAQGKISEQEYNRELLAIADQFAIDRINQEIATQQSILAIKEGRRDATALRMKVDGATPEDIAKFVSGANKGIQPTKDKLAGLGDDLTNAQSKQTVDQTKNGDKEAEERRKAQEFAAQQTIKAIDEIENLRQKAFEAEISRLEKLKEQVDENAENEKLQVQNSIASNATKARQIAVIDAQAAAQKKAIDAQEAKAKEKAAVADKEAAIAKIILNTAIAAIKAPAELGPILGLAAVPIVLALGAVELALAVATPIPKYARGTDNYPGGLGIWGEAGMERADLPDGTVHYSHGASLANFPKGTKITPHIELMQQIKPANVGYVGGDSIGWVEVVKAIKDNKQERARMRVVVNVDAGYEAYKRGYLSR